MQKWFPGRTLILLSHVWSFCHTNSLENDQKWPISPLESDLISLLQSVKKGLFFPSFYTFENRVIFLFKQKMLKLFLPYNKWKTICRVQKTNLGMKGKISAVFLILSCLISYFIHIIGHFLQLCLTIYIVFANFHTFENRVVLLPINVFKLFFHAISLKWF